jgi:hypothetical protein
LFFPIENFIFFQHAKMFSFISLVFLLFLLLLSLSNYVFIHFFCVVIADFFTV